MNNVNFVVYCNVEGRLLMIIAQTFFFEDAKAVLARWHSGYITDRFGVIQFSK